MCLYVLIYTYIYLYIDDVTRWREDILSLSDENNILRMNVENG